MHKKYREDGVLDNVDFGACRLWDGTKHYCAVIDVAPDESFVEVNEGRKNSVRCCHCREA